jgi:hypothetical protein
MLDKTEPISACALKLSLRLQKSDLSREEVVVEKSLGHVRAGALDPNHNGTTA